MATELPLLWCPPRRQQPHAGSQKNTRTKNNTYLLKQIQQQKLKIPSTQKTEKEENLFLGSCLASRGVQYPAVVMVLLPNDFNLAKTSTSTCVTRNKQH